MTDRTPNPAIPNQRRCTATRADGNPCRAWARRGTDPPLCAAHSGAPVGAPHGNKNAEKHGVYAAEPPEDVDLSATIADLNRRIRRLSSYIDRIESIETDPEAAQTYARLLALHGQLCSRLGRLLRDRHQIQGDDAGELDQAIAEALDLAGQTLGIKV